MVTTIPYSKIWNSSLSLIKLKPKITTDIEIQFANVLDGKMKRQAKMAASTEH